MIVFEKIRWKNFLSTGNQFTELGLNEDEGTLIIGNNGAGKSTMLDALCFCLFNKPFRKISKGLLVNTVNEKDCVVEVEFVIGTIKYKVIRGIKPGILEIYRQGNLLDQDAANRDYQKYLEQNILKLNYKSFTQVVILGSSTFVPFMQLPAGHRREVVEDLLDIQVFSHMNMLLKERVKDNNAVLRECKHELEMATNNIRAQEKVLSKLTTVNKERIAHQQQRFDENEQRMCTLKEEIGQFQDNINKLSDAIFHASRVSSDDPVKEWDNHNKNLREKTDWLNSMNFSSLHYSGPGTSLEIGLADEHEWMGGASESQNGIICNPNIPSEEVFTTPHALKVKGNVCSTKPLSYQGTLIQDIAVEFQEGKIVKASASKGESVLHKVLDSDEGARRLGEVALVPHSSPISQLGITFFNTLFDENAASHIALGQCYSKCFKTKKNLSKDEIKSRGGNSSMIHIDWMIGSGQIDVSGKDQNGNMIPIFKQGEWCN